MLFRLGDALLELEFHLSLEIIDQKSNELTIVTRLENLKENYIKLIRHSNSCSQVNVFSPTLCLSVVN